MSNAIRFLEEVGQSAGLRQATAPELEGSMTRLSIDPEMQAAVLHGNRAQIEALLSARTEMCCMVAPGREEDDRENEDSPAREDDEEMRLEALLTRRAAA